MSCQYKSHFLQVYGYLICPTDEIEHLNLPLNLARGQNSKLLAVKRSLVARMSQLETTMRAYLAALIAIFLTNATLAREAFVSQLPAKYIHSGEASRKGIEGGSFGASTVATPLSVSAARSVGASTSAPVNVSYIAQQGTDNLAAVTQTGGRNLSAVVQTGFGNQAVVTQRR
jgi:Curlin associated repeat